MADVLLGMLIFRSAICLLFSANEMISVLENVGNMGIPIPKFLRDRLSQVQKENSGNKEDKLANK